MRDWRTITPVEPGEGADPFWYMTIEQFDLGLEALVEGGPVLPYGLRPGWRPGGRVEAICTSWARWRSYEWDPPEFMPINAALLAVYGDTDWSASPKPSWQDIRLTYEGAAPGQLRGEMIEEANHQAKDRIAMTYVGQPDRIEELTWRLNGRATDAQNAERVRLVAVCHALEARIAEAATVEALEAIKVTSDAVWAPPANEGENDGS